MRPDGWWYAVGGLALCIAACGPGDHSRSSELNRFFAGGAAAGTAANGSKSASTSGSSDGPVVPSASTRPNAGTKAPPAQASVAAGRTASATASEGGAAGPQPIAAGAGGAGAAGAAIMPIPMSSPDAATRPATQGGSAAHVGGSGSAWMCPAGYLAVGTDCVCDLNGSYALHASIPVTSAAMGPVEALNATMHVWGLLHQQHDASGALSMSLSICAQTSPDICASAQPPVLSTPEAYGQYVPVQAWDQATAAPATTQLTLAAPLPGAAIDTPTLAQLFGIGLSDPLGAWPASFKDVQGTNVFDGSATNGAAWVDTDADGKTGLTMRIVGPGGVAGNGASGPLQSYGSASMECPRGNAQAARSPYNYLPLPQGLGVKRIKAIYSAQRIAFELHGTLDSCDAASGKLTGNDGGALAFDALVGGCSMLSGSGEADCTQAMVDTASQSGGVTGLKLGTGSFEWKRVAADATCAEIRAARDANLWLATSR